MSGADEARWAVYRDTDGWWVSSPPLNHGATGPRRFAAHWEAIHDADTRARMARNAAHRNGA